MATRDGGIPEVVVDGETGLLVPFEPATTAPASRRDPARFAADARRAGERAPRRPGARRARSARAGRGARSSEFGWAAIAERVAALYERVLRAWLTPLAKTAFTSLPRFIVTR